MYEESVVYGCIKDIANGDNPVERNNANVAAMATLPEADGWTLLSRDMFSTAPPMARDIEQAVQVIHFGAPYQGIEYEWESWIQQFENLLRRMYWASAAVHLETEMSGVHTFNWEADGGYHRPGNGDIQLRCEWVKEAI